jgi:hypothetical protein
METGDYAMAWLIYLVAALLFAVISWRALDRFLRRELAYLLECLLLALMLTPCAVIEDQPVMAPALIVFVLDSLTIAPKAGIRALIPLVLAVGLALLVAAVLSIIHRLRLRRTG